MPARRKEETIPARIRRSSYGVARRIAEDHSLDSVADAIEAALRGWDMLSREKQGSAVGDLRHIDPSEESWRKW